MSVNDENFDVPNALLYGCSGDESIWHAKAKIGTTFFELYLSLDHDRGSVRLSTRTAGVPIIEDVQGTCGDGIFLMLLMDG